jgi:polyisoprenoid-binding protein YceI
MLMVAISVLAGVAAAAPVRYDIDPTHTFPSFEADHQGGLSIWRGKLRSTKGTIVLDTEARTGEVDVVMEAASLDFGYDRMSERAKAADMFDVPKYPTIVYKGKLTRFKRGAPTEVDGTLTLHGVTRPLKLKINSFLCKTMKTAAGASRDTCGADASATFNRADFGIDFGAQMGFRMDVKLAIQVEATRAP